MKHIANTFYKDFWGDLNQLHGRLNDFYQVAGGKSYFPPVNIYRQSEQLVVVAEVPGVHPENLDISVSGNELTISGERAQTEVQTENAKSAAIRQERFTGKFKRTFELPFGIESSKVEANVKDGILTLVLPQAEAEKPHKVVIRAEK